jgi:hypothetical protein
MKRMMIGLAMVLLLVIGCHRGVVPPPPPPPIVPEVTLGIGAVGPEEGVEVFYDGPYVDVVGYVGVPLFFYGGGFFIFQGGHYFFHHMCPFEYRGFYHNHWRDHWGHHYERFHPEHRHERDIHRERGHEGRPGEYRKHELEKRDQKFEHDKGIHRERPREPQHKEHYKAPDPPRHKEPAWQQNRPITPRVNPNPPTYRPAPSAPRQYHDKKKY